MKAHKFKHDEESMKNEHESRITRLEVINENINATLLRLETKIDSLDVRLNEKIDTVERKLTEKIESVETKLNARIDKLDSRLWQIMILMGTTVLGFVITKMLGIF